jgi:hypothetical protein
MLDFARYALQEERVMAKVLLTFTLNRHSGFPPPHVAAAIDKDANNRADSGEFFVLRQAADALTWKGSLVVEADLDGLILMVVFLANIGAQYELMLRKTDAKGVVLAKQAGIVSAFPQLTFPVLRVPA